MDAPQDTPPDTDRRPPDTDRSATFADLGLRPELLAELTSLGYEEPTPIQAEAVPPLLAGRDLLGQAATGTGKTAAFALPLLQRLPGHRRGRDPIGLVLAPTRELAMQVSEALHRYGRGLGARVLPVYGGQPIGRQLRELERGVDIVVATPGRALDHLKRGTLRLDAVQVVVLDEADEMLDMGFADELDAIMAAAPTERQTVLFSATLPGHIDRLARRHLTDPVRIAIGRESVTPGTTPLVRQSAYIVSRADKPAALGRVLDVEQPAATLVFCRTREEVDSLTQTLNGRGYRAEPLHGGMSQDQRDRVMGRLRAQTADLLVATDVAARGLDVDHLTHVVNYDVPSAPDSYVHRIGRVGRAGREGVAITLAEPREQRMLHTIERVTGQRIPPAVLPSVADLRALRLAATRDAVREVLLRDGRLPSGPAGDGPAEDDGRARGELDRFRPVVEALTEEFDLEQVALAAVALAHEASGVPPDEREIHQPTPRSPTSRPDRPAAQHAGGDRAGRPRPQAGPRTPGRAGRGPQGDTTRLFVGSGRESGIRPQDLVGAVTGESSLSGRDIGAIEIFERFSLVEVPEAAADEVVAALRATLVKGRKVTVRRERADRRPARDR
ncbi:MAG TPA: DEAD/DEAH box helicase [Mycobacteriales bacterium]|nr:DEAD/DEAH box helicase [Mycobacteriales bacterium]